MVEQAESRPPDACPMCRNELRCVWVYDAPPEGETRFDLGSDTYHREIHQCQVCGHFVSIGNFDLSRLYEGAYVGATYGRDGMRQTFERIVALPPEKSDNLGRVGCIRVFAECHFQESVLAGRSPTILDVGSGLGVFPYQIQKSGWTATALDPDPNAVAHISEVAGVSAICGDFMKSADLGKYDVISFNKVLEHVTDPVAMLAQSKNYLQPGGFVYVELPDGEAAADAGFGREEFFVEHHHVFSMASIILLGSQAGFRTLTVERLREPSSKFTLRAFLKQ
ncbi:class I SAM-dependent methyltransferase [bacterium]|nr:class I SAM-dependent methyltransferase [bacterium]